MTDLSNIKFFVTPQHRCSYLPRREASTLFADPQTTSNPDVYSELSLMGFRRSGNYLYRPHCRSCSACIPARVPVTQFHPTRKHRRVLKANQDLAIELHPASNCDEHFQLYSRYILDRHPDGDMHPPSRPQYESFLLSDWGQTYFMDFRLAERLICVAVCDVMKNGLAAVYTYYDPTESHRSLGVLAVLKQIEETQRRALPALYLGYWIGACKKMNYKTQYQPLELFFNNRWQPHDPAVFNW